MDNLTAREETREKSEGSLGQLTIVRGGIAKLHVNVDLLSFTDISILWGEVRFPNMPESVRKDHIHEHTTRTQAYANCLDGFHNMSFVSSSSLYTKSSYRNIITVTKISAVVQKFTSK